MPCMFSPSRVAAALAALSGLAAAVAVPVANLDVTSTVGVVAGLVAILGAAAKWLDGRAKWEIANAWREYPPPTPVASSADDAVPLESPPSSLHANLDG